MAETIREFLVSLGYKVDGNSEAKFKNSVGAATKAVVQLGTVITAAGVAVAAAVTKISKGFDEIYYMSQRTNASVQNIKSLGYAVSQLGGTFQGAISSIESFGQKLRSNPGYESLVRSLGVATQQNGRLRDTVEIAKDLAKALGSKPYYVQLQYMEALGLDERTFRALQSGELTRYIEEYRKKQEALGVDQEVAARTGRDLSNAWRQLGLTAATMGEKLMIDVAPHLERILKGFDEFLIKHKDKIGEGLIAIGRAAEIVAKAFVAVAEALGPVLTKLDELSKQFTGEGALTVALTAFAAWLTGSWLLRILGAFASVGTGFAGMLLRLGINPATIGFAIGMAPSTANGGEDEEIARRRANGTWGGKNAFNGENAVKDNRNWWQRTMPKILGGKDAPTASGGSNAPIRGSTFTQKAPGIMRRLMEDFGFTREQAAGIVGNLGHESSGFNQMQERNPASGRGGYGWAQWTGPRRKAFEAWAEANGLDPSSDEANYGFLRHELRTNHSGVVDRVKAAGSVDEAMLAFETGYERAGVKNYPSRQKWAQRALRAAERAAQNSYMPAYTPFSSLNAGSLATAQTNAALIGGNIQPLAPSNVDSSRKVEMNQRTEITVLGGSDPAATGSAVSDAQKGVNGTMLRNMQGAVR